MEIKNPILLKLNKIKTIVDESQMSEVSKNEILTLVYEIKSLYILDDSIVKLLPTIVFDDDKEFSDRQRYFKSLIAYKYIKRKDVFFGGRKA